MTSNYKLVYYVNRAGDIVLTAKTYRRRYNRRATQRHGRVLFVTNKGKAYLDELAAEALVEDVRKAIEGGGDDATK